MNNLVKVENHVILTDTQIIAKELGMKHAYVMRVVEQFLEDFPDLRVIQTDPKNSEYIQLKQRNYRGRDFSAAVMNRECFTLLFMRFETKKARELQRKFNSAFYEMEKALLREKSNSDDPMWVTSRNQSKAIRLGETDIIKQFVEYATTQGSQSAQFYYKHITLTAYKCLQLIESQKPKLRDTLNCMELANLMAAEGVAGRSLLKHMESGEHYKAIYELVKQDLEKFADGLMLKRIH